MSEKPLPEALTRLLNSKNLEYRRELARLRKEAEDEVERLIAFLDRIAPDPDLEDDELEVQGDDEPSLGWTDNRRSQEGGCLGTDDFEQEHDGREPDDEDAAVDDGMELDLAECAQ